MNQKNCFIINSIFLKNIYIINAPEKQEKKKLFLFFSNLKKYKESFTVIIQKFFEFKKKSTTVEHDGIFLKFIVENEYVVKNFYNFSFFFFYFIFFFEEIFF